ncbi:MAG: substrate-binding domain-containing protein [Phycisphaeraceae bacterium]|nr:substrate-binding domain-containing protein [Phycisphaeraceae bacterium]
MRTFVVTVLVSIISLLCFACGQQSSPPPAAQADRTLTLAVIPKSTGGEFWETVQQGAQQAADELGVKIRWEGTLGETEIAEQNKIIENMINLGVDGIVLAPLNTRAMRKNVQAATDAGIPVVIMDSAVEGDAQVSFVATDNHKGGVVAAEGMKQFLGGDLNGKRLLVQRYVQGTGSTEARADGFIETVKAGGAQVLADPYPEDGTVAGTKKTASNTLEGFVKDGKLQLDGIFAANLYSTVGMAAALNDMRKGGVNVELIFIGFDTDPRLLRQLQSDNIHALVSQNPRKMGYLAVQTMVNHLRGREVPEYVETQVELVTRDRLQNEPEIRQLVGLE